MSAEYSEVEASAMDDFRGEMRMVAQLQQQRAQLTASGSTRDKRVTVTVNANGVPIDIKFSSDIYKLGYPAIAASITEAAQLAAAEVARLGEQLVEPLLGARDERPRLSELVAEMPDVASHMPTDLEVSTAAPGSAEPRVDEAADGAGMVFDDVEDHAHRGDTSEISGRSW